MKSFTSILVAGLAAIAQAVELTNSNYDIQAGQPFEITWTNAQGPVTLTLKNGPETNLQDVSVITSGASGNSFTWTPSASLPTDQYAIQITDGSGTPNYSPQFTLTTSVTASPSISSATSAVSTVTSTVVSSITSAASSSASASETAVSSAANSTVASSTVATSTRVSTRTSATSESTTAPTTVPGGDAGRIGSPIALIGLTIAAMLYFQ
ncbi:hypothetical protein CCHL11_01990 [Colletotrichum chlorophyti]|uniref:Yeast cell wall synthesis Kre9/Knh1-like N-terminal domain-containing protein n=1 Tax=Colletotrichum chlorophyti TaxID=708187 RepID=A0A1Q8RWD3_9PEZI|nr:hypothetical protein CCHL11_01990 [Colletotrichum chlorophyti]